MSKLILVMGMVVFSLTSQAHPVSFKGSTGIMGHHSPFMAHNQINYSFEYWWALGVHHFQNPQDQDLKASVVTSNFLLKRWNGKSFQSNLYALVGGGISTLDGIEQKGTGAVGLQYDIEDRRYYFLAKHMNLLTKEDSAFYQSVVRVGIAPYEGDFDELHAWLILEWRKNEWGQGFVMEDTTPMLRFFYQNLLFEIGQSFRGLTRFNYIIHF